MLDEVLEWLFDKIHGLGFAVAILAALLAFAAARKDPVEELILTLSIWAATIFLFYLGSRLDGILYDPTLRRKRVMELRSRRGEGCCPQKIG
jgi:hypothetical protein